METSGGDSRVLAATDAQTPTTFAALANIDEGTPDTLSGAFSSSYSL